MSCYENLVMKTQMNYSRHYSTYASGGTAVVLSKQKPLPYEEQIQEFVRRAQEAECIVVGGASGLSAAGGGDFYYSDTPSFREHFGKFADKYGFKGAFSGMMHRFSTRNEHWGYVATFLNATQNAPIRDPYLDLDRILQGKDFHILTTNQDTQFVKIYPEEKVSEIQGDHRFFQCSQCCQDETWDAVQPVADMIAAMGEGTMVPDELIPRCPHCGAEMFPWVRGYGNFLQGKKYEEEYEKISKYIQKNKDRKILFIELGVGRMTPMFIQEPFWELTNSLKGAFSGMMHRFSTRNEHWGYVATFLNATQNAPIRDPYLDLDRILQGKDFHILTTNQDTQFVKIYPEEKVSEIQGDHRFFQCSQCCQDETWDAVQPVADMIAAMGEGTMVPDELIPRCPHCGAEMFPWVRGYGNFLQGKKYEEEYEKISKYIQKNKDRKILFIELGVGRMTPMFIQEPFWELTNSLKDAYYISVNSEYQFLPEFIEDKGIAILGDIGTVLKDLRKAKEESAFV